MDPCLVRRGRGGCKVPSVQAVGVIQQQSKKEEQQMQLKDSMLKKIIQSNTGYNLPFSVHMWAGFGHMDHPLRNLCSSQFLMTPVCFNLLFHKSCVIPWHSTKEKALTIS